MEQLVYLGGRFVPVDEAKVPFLDRGHLFGDGVYEVYRLYGGRPFTRELHLDRFDASCRALELRCPYSRAGLERVLDAVEAQAGPDSYIYLQLTRGSAPRRHAWLGAVEPALAAMAVPLGDVPSSWYSHGVGAITHRDQRWACCHIKSLNLLPNCMAMTRAQVAGAFDAVLVDAAGQVTEAAASSVFAVIDGVLRTAPTTCNILPGITRRIVLELAREAGLPVAEVTFTATELASASEAFFTTTPYEITPICRLDGRPLPPPPWPLTRRLMRLYAARVKTETGALADCAATGDRD
jgi:D-alanine transaminase